MKKRTETRPIKVDRENYEKYWDDLAPFIKFGCIKDEKFCEKISDYLLFKDLDHKYLTLNEYRDSMGWEKEGKQCGTVLSGLRV